MHHAAAVGLAIGACVLFSLSAAVQQRASALAPGRSGGISGVEQLMLALVRNPLWAIGAVINAIGFGVQAVALHLGSVSVVQSVMPTQLLFALAFASIAARHFPTVADWVSGAAICGGVILLVTDDHRGGTYADVGRVALFAACVAVVICVLLLAAHRFPPPIAAATTAVAAGCSFATTSVLLKITADRAAAEGFLGLLTLPAFYGLLCTCGLGIVLTQAALAAGPLPWAMAAMTITNPTVSYVAAVVAFGASAPTLWVAVCAGALLVTGILGLARSRSAVRWTPVQPERAEIRVP
ncbi:DMT family transporter [Nocardioides sp. NPDC057772]|uniref:DMT family transporter n=1 Tax=Nocardioides sp. NPDC057772 TaxID=3346245 RepID=UPI00367077FD